MPRVHHLKNNMSAGELSPLVQGRTDYPGYASGAAELHNWLVLLQGGMTTRPGLHYAWAAKEADRLVRVLPFEFAVSQAYVLECGHEYFRFGRNGARLALAGVPVEVLTPYQESELFALRTAQSNDVLYLVHGSHAPHKLVRLSDTNWTLLPLTLRPPPSVERGLTPEHTLILTALSGTGVAATASGAVFLAADVDRQIVSGLGRAVIRAIASPADALLDILDPFAATPLGAGAWTIEGSPIANLTPSGVGPVGALVTLTLSPSTLNTLIANGEFDSATGWTDLDTGTGTSTIAGGALTLDPGAGPGVASREQLVTGLTAGVLYAVRYDTATQVAAIQIGTASGLADVLGETYTALGPDQSVTFSATGPSAYFQVRLGIGVVASRVDNVRLFPAVLGGWRPTDADGTHYVKAAGGIVRLTTYTSNTQVSGEVLRDLASTAEIVANAWTLEEVAWSPTRGYPTAVGLAEQRLWFARGQTVWGSVTGDYEHFGAGPAADDSVEYTIASPHLNPIQWLIAPRTLLVGTAAEITRFAGVSGGPVTPSSVQALSEDSIGSAAPQALRIGNTVLFVQREHVALLELVYSGAADSYTPDEVSKLAEHLFAGGATITELCYEPRPPTLLWAVRSDGVLLACTYSSKEKLAAFARVTTAGLIESVCRLPASGGRGSQVWTVVQREIAGTSRRYLEYFDEALHVDCGLTYSGAAVSTLTGLSHLEGETVEIIGNGAVYPPQQVTSGQVTGLVPAVTSAEVGVLYTCRAVLLEPEVPLQSGPTQQSQKRYGEVSLRLHATRGLVVNGETLAFRTAEMAMDTGVPTFTGKVRVMNFGWDREARLVIETRQPFPATVLSVTSTLLIGD